MMAAASALPSVTRGADSISWARAAITTTNAPPLTAARRIDGRVDDSRVRAAIAPRRRSWGNTSSTTNRSSIGTARRKLPPQSNDVGIRPLGRWNAMRVAKPRTTAPTNVIGRFRSRPNMAAANALMTRRVSKVELSEPPWNGVMRIPASAESETPIIQLTSEMRSGRAPLSSSNDPSSTTARIETPTRLRYSSTRRAMARSTATSRIVTSCHSNTTPNHSTLRPAPNRGGIEWGRAGVHTQFARAMAARSTEIGTTSFTSSEVSFNPRMTTVWRIAPNSGATTSSTTPRASGAGHAPSGRSGHRC